jgi:teichuronic acid biosynthesis glycosyltransferase TuaG
MSEKVSVIIPTFNRTATTVNAIKSALAQTLTPFEIIVVDDGSQDEIRKALSKEILSLSSPSIKIIWAEAKRHPGIIRNIGIRHATGEWIAFLDSDDTWSTRKTEVQIKAMLEYDALASHTSTVSNKANLSTKPATTPNKRLSLNSLINGNSIVNSSVIVSRSLLARIGLIADSYAVRGVEDYATWLRIASISQWLTIPNELVFYEDSSSDSIRLQNGDNYFGMTQAHLDFIMWNRERRYSGTTKKLIKESVKLAAKFGG